MMRVNDIGELVEAYETSASPHVTISVELDGKVRLMESIGMADDPDVQIAAGVTKEYLANYLRLNRADLFSEEEIIARWATADGLTVHLVDESPFERAGDDAVLSPEDVVDAFDEVDEPDMP